MPNNKTIKTNVRMSHYHRFLHQEGQVSTKELNWRYPQFAVRSIYGYAKKNPSNEIPVDSRKFSKGRPYKISIAEYSFTNNSETAGFVRVVHCQGVANRKWTYSC